MHRKERMEADIFGRSTDSRAREHLFKWDRKRFYDYYFAGYDFETVVDVGGHRKIVRRYNGVLYRQELTPKEAVRIRVLCAGLAAVSAAAFLSGLFLHIVSNRCWYVMLVAGITALFFVRFLFALHPYIWSKREMREYEYRRGAQLLPGRKWPVLISLAGLAAAVCVMFVMEPGSYTHLELLRFVLLLLSGFCVWSIGSVESKVSYRELRPEDRKNLNHMKLQNRK